MKIFENVSSLKDATLRARQLVETKGYYSPGDGGQARYLIKTAVEYSGTPDEYGDHTLANGNVAELQYEGAVNVKWFGAVGDGATDDSDALNAAFLSANVVELLPYHKVLKQVTVGVNKKIVTPQKTTIDGSSVDFDASINPNVLQVGGEEMTQIAALASNVSKEDQTLVFNAPHGLEVGDIICIYDPTDYSFSSARAYYRSGEFCEVAHVATSTEVILSNGLYAAYNATVVGVYKMTMSTFIVEGQLEVVATKPTVSAATIAIRLDQIKHSTISGLVGKALEGAYTAVSLVRCFNVSLPDTVATQETLSGYGGDYGLAISNSQHIQYSGYFSASRHGVTHGGYDGVGGVPCRDISGRGTVKTTNEGLVQALDCHGNCEDISFDGMVYGGVSPGGSGFKFRGVCYGDIRGLCVYSGEVRTFDFDFSGAIFKTDKDPHSLASERGVVDFGGSSVFEVDNMTGGVLNLSGIRVVAPNAKRGLVLSTSNTTVTSESRIIDLRGAHFDLNPTGFAYLIRDLSGVKDFNKVLTLGLTHNASFSQVVNTTYMENHSESGLAPYTTNTDVSFLDLAVTFNQPFEALHPPSIQVCKDRSAIGWYIDTVVLSATVTGCTLRLYTINGSKFGAEVSGSLMWTAS